MLVAVYALCVVAPAAALALADAATAVHCLTGDHHSVAKVHVHADGASHQHSGDRDHKSGQPGNCCGLFCVSGIAQVFDVTLYSPAPLSEVPVLVVQSISGRSSDRIDRPPRSLPSL
jgi:hypothetical protein